jgi:CheY-like chemotaxis protein
MSTILVVDDEPTIRAVLIRYLAPTGHQVFEAASAEDALAVLRTLSVDIVLCDLAMPGHDGLWLIDRLRERYPDVAIILATGNVEVPGAITLQPAIANYLVKPFDRHSVVAAANDAIAWRRSRLNTPQRVVDVDAFTAWLDTPIEAVSPQECAK